MCVVKSYQAEVCVMCRPDSPLCLLLLLFYVHRNVQSCSYNNGTKKTQISNNVDCGFI